jgi:hypothetical protein
MYRGIFFGGFEIECIYMAMPSKCVHVLNSYLLFFGKILFTWTILKSFMLSMDMLLVEFSSDDISDGVESVSSLVDAVVMDSWHVLMYGDRLSGCIFNPL